jgi:hypothetical protein
MTMNPLTRILVAALLLAELSGSMYAQKVGTTSLQFLKVLPTARAAAMGDAYVAEARGADAQFWNPAGMSLTQTHEITSTITEWLFDTRQIAIAYAMPLGDWPTVGIQFQYINYGSIKETREDLADLVVNNDGRFFNPGLTGRSFSPYAYVLGMTVAKAFTDKFSAGATMKYVKEVLWMDQSVVVEDPITHVKNTYKTYTDVILYDIGMLYSTGFRSVKIGIAVQNFGPQVTYATESRPAPLAFRIGGSANLMGTDALLLTDNTNRFTVAFDLQPNDYKQQIHVGAEYALSEVVALRVGYKVDYDTEGLTFGGGVAATLAGVPITVDYGFGKMSAYMNSVHRISVGVQFR